MLGPFNPRIGIVLGSGLGAVAEAVAEPVIVPYAEIPHFPRPPSRATRAESSRACWARRSSGPSSMQGRVHFYEGYTPQQVTFPMRVLGALGIQSVVLTNAAGGIAEGYQRGPACGARRPHQPDGLESSGRAERAALCRPPRRGPCAFTDMTEAYSKRLRALAREAAAEEGFALDEGIYLAVSGPSFETPAEIRAFRTLGATLVGMSTVPETIVARHMGIEVLGLSCVTNLAAGLGATPLSHEEVFEAGRQVEQRLARLLERLAPRIAALTETPEAGA